MLTSSPRDAGTHRCHSGIRLPSAELTGGAGPESILPVVVMDSLMRNCASWLAQERAQRRAIARRGVTAALARVHRFSRSSIVACCLAYRIQFGTGIATMLSRYRVYN